RRAEQCIAQRMQQHVAVGMGDQPELVGNPYTTEGDEIAFAEAMNVVAVTDTHRAAHENLAGNESARDSTPGRRPASPSPRHRQSSAGSSNARCPAKPLASPITGGGPE